MGSKSREPRKGVEEVSALIQRAQEGDDTAYAELAECVGDNSPFWSRTGDLVRRVHIDEETIEWVVEALKASHADKKEHHEEQVARLEGELKRLRARMDAVYEDKLDRRIGEDFWERKRREYQARQAEIMRSLEQHQTANTFYFDAGVRVLRLAQKAYELWLAQPQTEKRRLLDVPLSNCTFDGENLGATYRRPFCWLAEGPLRSIWRARRDLNPRLPA